MEVVESKGILETFQNGGDAYNASLEYAKDEEREEEESGENWRNLLPVEVSIETFEDDGKPVNPSINEANKRLSDSEEDFYGFEDGEIPVPLKLRVQQSKSSSKKVSQCPHCYYQTPRRDHFKRHVLRHPEQTLYPSDHKGSQRDKRDRSCSICGYTTGRIDHFKRHLMRHTGEKPYSCSCGYSTTHMIHLKRHLLRFPEPKTHYSITGKANYSSLNGPLAVSSNSTIQKLDSKKLVLEESVSNGILHEEPIFQKVTEGLGFAAVLKGKFKITKEKTVDSKDKEAPESGEMFTESTQIKGECLSNGDIGEWGIGLWPVEVNMEDTNDCVSGNSSASEELIFENFQKDHSTITFLVSDEENEDKLRKRRRALPHVCKECGYSTMRGDHFKRHLMRHTGEKPYSCSICNYRSTHAIHLKRHMSTHTDDRPFRCSHCPFRAIRPHHLREHIRLHTGERPYVCHLCGFSAAQSGNYRSHMRTHLEIKPFTCELCGYSTAKDSNLVSHMKTHMGLKGHICQFCDYSAIKSIDLARHIKRVHNIELT